MEQYWKSAIEDAQMLARTAKKAEVRLLGASAGGRDIYLFFYGKKNELHRTANYSSALGARDAKYYADKTQPGYRPSVLLVGSVHGAEFEGSVAIMNLIQVLETGKDFSGKPQPALLQAAEQVNLLLVPFINPDGRARVPLESLIGQSFETLRYYGQGTWKADGELCGWPGCKAIHPILDAADFLGGYFNDNGINLMHDHPFMPMAEETKILYRLAEEFVPDFTVLLHGGDNCDANYFLKPAYAPECIKKRIAVFEKQLEEKCAREGVRFKSLGMDCGENADVPASFNLASALTHLCGEPCVTYESNQGLTGAENPPFSAEEIYRLHLLLFEQLCAFVLKEKSAEA